MGKGTPLDIDKAIIDFETDSQISKLYALHVSKLVSSKFMTQGLITGQWWTSTPMEVPKTFTASYDQAEYFAPHNHRVNITSPEYYTLSQPKHTCESAACEEYAIANVVPWLRENEFDFIGLGSCYLFCTEEDAMMLLMRIK